MRVLVNELLDWRGVPIISGGSQDTPDHSPPRSCAWLEPINEGRDKWDRITYDSLWIHFQGHYSLAGITAYWGAQMSKEFKEFKEALRG